jgi:hypothetical protein
MWWVIVFCAYMCVGLIFPKPEEWGIIKRILANIFWLPLLIFLWILFFFGFSPI